MDGAAIGIVSIEQLQLKWDCVYFILISNCFKEFWPVISAMFGMLSDVKAVLKL